MSLEVCPFPYTLACVFYTSTAAGTFWYLTYKDRNPGPQLPSDPSKKTLVILGSGWGATSLLKGLDTADYNTVCPITLSSILHLILT